MAANESSDNLTSDGETVAADNGMKDLDGEVTGVIVPLTGLGFVIQIVVLQRGMVNDGSEDLILEALLCWKWGCWWTISWGRSWPWVLSLLLRVTLDLDGDGVGGPGACLFLGTFIACGILEALVTLTTFVDIVGGIGAMGLLLVCLLWSDMIAIQISDSIRQLSIHGHEPIDGIWI